MVLVLRCLPSQFQEAIHTLKAAGIPDTWDGYVDSPGVAVIGSKSLNKGMIKPDELNDRSICNLEVTNNWICFCKIKNCELVRFGLRLFSFQLEDFSEKHQK